MSFTTHTSHWEINAFDDEAWCAIEEYLENNKEWLEPDFELDDYIESMTQELFNTTLKFATKSQCLTFIQDVEWLEKVYDMVLNDLTAEEIGEAKDIVRIFNLCWYFIGVNLAETYVKDWIDERS